MMFDPLKQFNYLKALREIPEEYVTLGVKFCVSYFDDKAILYVAHPKLPALRCFIDEGQTFEQIENTEDNTLRQKLGKPHQENPNENKGRNPENEQRRIGQIL